uniref:C3H1-type domain-containing protein n=1 Tax=Megaviridae environmental sample TaxID=1737588 RepID=A0A5J6VKW6_9VIRU|nr:MAG: hypothetical protein [Megaviridae environmental sample]
MKEFMDKDARGQPLETPEHFEGYSVRNIQLSGNNATTIAVITDGEYAWIPLERTYGLEQVAQDQGCAAGVVPKSLFVCLEWLKFCFSYFDSPESTCTNTHRDHCAYHPMRPMCAFFPSGKCKHGPRCNKLHLIDCTVKEAEPQEISAEAYYSSGRIIPSAAPTVQLKPREQKSYTRRNHQMCLAHLCGTMRGLHNTCKYGPRCNFAHTSDELEYIYKDAEKAFTQFILSEDKTHDGEDASSFFQNTYDELKTMFTEHRDIVRQIILRGRVANKMTVTQLDTISVKTFPDMLCFWFSLATITRNPNKRCKLAQQISCSSGDIPPFEFTKWEDFVWALARRSLRTCRGYLTMMEIAGDGAMSRQLDYNWSACCRSGIYCTRGTHPHEFYIKDDISYVIDFSTLVDETKSKQDYETKRSELQGQLDTAKAEYGEMKDKFHETQEAAKTGSRFVRVGEIKELSESLSKIKAKIYKLTSAKHQLFKKCNPCEFGFDPIRDVVPQSTAVATCIIIPRQAPETAGELVAYDPNRARASLLASGAVSLYASAAKTTKPAIEAPPVRKRAAPPKPVVQQSDPVEPEPVKKKPEKVFDEDGFEMVTTKPKRYHGKKKTKPDIDISDFYQSGIEQGPAKPEEPEVEDTKPSIKAIEIICVDKPADEDSNADNEKAVQDPVSPIPVARPEQTSRFWDCSSDESSDDEDDGPSKGEIFAEPEDSFSKRQYLLKVKNGNRVLYLTGFKTNSIVTTALKKLGYTIKVTGGDCLVVCLKKLALGRPHVFQDFMSSVYTVLQDINIKVAPSDIQNDTPWNLPLFVTRTPVRATKSTSLSTRLLGVEQGTYSHYIKKHRETIKKRTTKTTLVGPFTSAKANIMKAKLDFEGYTCSVTLFKASTYEVTITPQVQSGKTEIRDMLLEVIPTCTKSGIKIE